MYNKHNYFMKGCFKLNCDHCGSDGAKILMTWEDKQERFCHDCYNEMMAKELGVPHQITPKNKIVRDAFGNSRFFTIEKRLDPVGFFLEAIEQKTNGYKFAVHGELDCNQDKLYDDLLQKVREGVSTLYIEKGKFPNGQQYHSMVGDEVVGRIEHDEYGNGTPLIIVDGKPYTWDNFGKMLKSNEGFQFKLSIFDFTEDVE